ncbi:MAG: GumC domain-containing protein [Fimbriimonadaceae bacterium]
MRVLVVAFVVGLGAGLLTYLLHPRYESTELIIFPGAPPTSSSAISSVIGDKLSGSSDDGAVPMLSNLLSTAIVGSTRDAALAIVTSRGCLAYVVTTLDLQHVYKQPKLTKAMRELKDRLSASVDKQGMLNITAIDEESPRAVQIVKTVEAYLRRETDKLALNLSRKNRQFVQEQLGLERKNLTRVEALVQRDLASKPLTVVEERSRSIEAIHQAAIQARVRADGAYTEIARSEAALKRVLNQTGTYSGSAIALGTISGVLNNQATDLLQRRQDLEAAERKYAKSSTEVQLAQKEFDAAHAIADGVFKEEMSNLTRTTREEPSLIRAKAAYASVEREADEYEAAVQRMTAQLAADASQYVQNQFLQSEYKAAIERYTRMQMDLAIAKIAESRDPARFEVLDEPAVTDEAVYPKRPLTSGVVFFLMIVIQLVPLLFSGSRGPVGDQQF